MPTENLSPQVPVMKHADNRLRHEVPDPLDGTMTRPIFRQRPARPNLVVIDRITLQNSARLPLAETMR